MNQQRPARHVRSVDDVLELMDELFDAAADRWSAGAGASWWDCFYQDRARPVPFFEPKPDENLVSYLDRALLVPGRALDLGCGPGRNALYLAENGFTVEGIDLSQRAITWAAERAGQAGVDIAWHCGDAFRDGDQFRSGGYDLIYDSGCLHHLPPHRRISYLCLLERMLAPGGHFGLTCFAAGAMGSELPDGQLYQAGGLDGGLAFTPESLRWIFADFEEIEIRPMRPQAPHSTSFGLPSLVTGLFRRRGVADSAKEFS